MSLESQPQSVEDVLTDSLQFKLHHGASYATDRKSVSYFSSGGNSYAPGGVKVIKISVNGQDWLDPSTVKLFFDITNTATSGTGALALTPLVNGAWGFFRRMRVICGGQILEDLDSYGRLHEMFHMMKSSNKRLNDGIEGFGDGETVGYGKSRTVCFTPMSGILNQKKYLPIRYAPLQFEFELVGSASDALNVAVGSEKFEISNVQLKCDLVTLDNSLDNEYAQHLLDGGNLPINFGTFTTASQVISHIKSSVNVQRAFTRMKSVYVSLSNDQNSNKSEVDDFLNPMGATYDFQKELQFQMQLGNKLFPEYPIRSVAESYYQLRKVMGDYHSNTGAMDINPQDYRSTKYVIGIDTEKMLGSSFSGMETKTGSMLTLRLDQANGGAALPDVGTTKIHYALEYDVVLQINDTGVTILE